MLLYKNGLCTSMFLSVIVLPLHVLLLWPTLPHFLQTTNFDCLGSLKLVLGSSLLLFLTFFGLLGSLLITDGSMTSLCIGGHKFGPLHGNTINKFVDKKVDCV